MAQSNYTVSLVTSDQLNLSAGVTAAVLPLLNQAVRAAAQATASNWMSAVHQARGIWSVEKDAYVASIKWHMTGDFSAYVYADYKYAYEIEYGRPARDLKKMLDTSLKVRRTLKGRRFLVIPFRHNTPGNNALAKAMPAIVHDMAANIEKSKVTGSGTRPSGEVTTLSPKTGMHPAKEQTPFLSNPKTKQAAMVASRQYQWGGRLTAAMLKQAGMPKEDVRRYAGMVRFDTSTGGSKSSQYMTFRVMMEGSSGWIVPAKPGQYIAQKVAADMQPKAAEVFAKTISKIVTGS